MQKRQLEETEGGAEELDVDVGALKKAKRDNNSTALVSFANTSQALTTTKQSTEPGRTSSLLAPEVSLLGHGGAVYSIDFDPSGNFLASGSYDKQICKYFIEKTIVAINYVPKIFYFHLYTLILYYYYSFMGYIW